jgi:trehalose-phosphatase
VRPATIDKGDVVKFLDDPGAADFRLAVGDDRTDEDLFRRLGPAGWTVHVGEGPSLARFRLGGPADVCDLLRHMVHAAGN